MRIENGRESENVEDRRGETYSGGGGLGIGGRSIGIGTIVLALVAMYFGVDPSIVLNTATGPAPIEAPAGPAAKPPPDDRGAKFMSQVLADTEDTWKAIFAQNGKQYVEPKLVLFSGATPTACGTGQAAMGPFYCPGDQKVYIDLRFYDELKTRFRAPGDFAQAYVLAHEVGHHVQNQLGISEKVDRMRQRASEAEGNQLSVRLELQADCFAGIWANQADRSRKVLESGDIEEGLNAATAIGDDTLQRQTRGMVVPESFTHGSSAQRVRWFKRGLETGDVRQCDTFATRQL
jgi:predicted metalloprotease